MYSLKQAANRRAGSTLAQNSASLAWPGRRGSFFGCKLAELPRAEDFDTTRRLSVVAHARWWRSRRPSIGTLFWTLHWSYMMVWKALGYIHRFHGHMCLMCSLIDDCSVLDQYLRTSGWDYNYSCHPEVRRFMHTWMHQSVRRMHTFNVSDIYTVVEITTEC